MKKFTFLFAVLFLFSCGNSDTPEANTTTVPLNRVDELPGTIDSLNAYLNTNPDDADAHAKRAMLYLDRRNIQFAQADAEEALRLDSTNATGHLAMGSLFYIQNKTRLARNYWTRCVELDPQSVDCRMRLAELYLAVRNFDKAQVLLNEVTEIDKKNATAYLMKGVIARDFSGDTALALNYFQRAIDLDQDYMDAIDLMAVSLANQGDTLAKYYYQRMLELEPNRADVYYKLGVYHMGIGEYNRALEAYEKAIQLNPKDAQSYYNVGFIYIEVRSYSDAIPYFTKAIQFKERNYEAYYARGYCYELVGNADAALKDYRKSLEILKIYTPASEGIARIKRMDAEIAAERARNNQ